VRAAWYDARGPAREVLRVGELPLPVPGPGELRVRVAASGVNRGDVGKRGGAWSSEMPFPRVIPHGDGAGVVEAVGAGVSQARVGEHAWVFLAQSYRPFGTAAELVVVPAEHAVPLSEEVPFEQGACLGIPGITGHRAIFADGPVDGLTVVVTGAVGAVGRAAVAVARRGGARVIATVRRPEHVDLALDAGAHHAIDASAGDVAARIEAIAGRDGVDRVAEVAFEANVDTDLRILAVGGTIATYATDGGRRPSLPFWELGFKNVTIRCLSNDDFPADANRAAAQALTEALQAGDLRYPIAARHALAEIADAHEAVERDGGGAGRVVVMP